MEIEMKIEDIITEAALKIVVFTAKEDYPTLINDAKKASESILNFIEFSNKIAEKEETNEVLVDYLLTIVYELNESYHPNSDIWRKYLKLFYLNILYWVKD